MFSMKNVLTTLNRVISRLISLYPATIAVVNANYIFVFLVHLVHLLNLHQLAELWTGSVYCCELWHVCLLQVVYVRMTSLCENMLMETDGTEPSIIRLFFISDWKVNKE
jgi:hypothetical protein